MCSSMFLSLFSAEGRVSKQHFFYATIILTLIIPMAWKKRSTKGGGQGKKKKSCSLSVPAFTEINKLFKVIRKQHDCHPAATGSESPQFAPPPQVVSRKRYKRCVYSQLNYSGYYKTTRWTGAEPVTNKDPQKFSFLGNHFQPH